MKDAEIPGEDEIGSIERFIVYGAAIRDERLRSIIAEIGGWSAQKWTYEDAPNLVVYSVIELAYSYPKRANDLVESMRTLMQSDRCESACKIDPISRGIGVQF